MRRSQEVLSAARRCSCHAAKRAIPVAASLIRRRPLSSAAATVPAPSSSTSGLLLEMKDLLEGYPVLRDPRWSTRLEETVASLSHARPTRIALVGDRSSGVSELVTAAFDDPLASKGDLSVALASRRLGHAAEAILIAYGNGHSSEHELHIPSPWLLENNAELVEIVHGEMGPLDSSVDALYSADAVVILLHESRGWSVPAVHSLLSQLSSKPNLLVALNAAERSNASTVKSLQAQLASLSGGSDIAPAVMAISTERALNALEALAPTEAGHSISFEKFQKGYVSSGVPQLKDRLAQIAAGAKEPASGSDATPKLRQQTARHVLSKAVSMAALEGARLEDELHQVSSDVDALAFEATETSEAVLESLGVEDGLMKLPSEDITDARASFDALLQGRLTWYMLPSRIDDLVPEIAVVASTSYLPQFEDQLVFTTGQLISLSQTLSKKTDDLLATPAFSAASRDSSPLSSLHSPTLLNRIAQAERESSILPSTALSSSIVARRNQITAPGGPAETLQSRAQNAVASAASLTSGSLALGAGMQFMQVAELATNVGVGLLGTTLAAWLLQRSWGRAKGRFLVDVERRVTDGLEEDLGVAAQQLVERSTYKARTAVALSEEALRHKRGDFDRFKQRLASIADRTRQLK